MLEYDMFHKEGIYMYQVSEILLNLRKYGNARVYEADNQSGRKLKHYLQIDKKGGLFADGTIIDQKYFINLFASLIYESIYKKISIKSTLIEVNENANYEFVNIMICMLMKMLDKITYNDIAKTILGDEKTFTDILASKEIDFNYSKIITIEELDEQLKYLENTMLTMFLIWKEMQEAGNVKEYNKAREKWDALCQDAFINDNNPKR